MHRLLVDLHSPYFEGQTLGLPHAAQFCAGSHPCPHPWLLVRSGQAHLHTHAMLSAQVHKVVALQQLVRELGEANAGLTLHAGAHLAQGEEGFEQTDVMKRGPISWRHECIRAGPNSPSSQSHTPACIPLLLGTHAAWPQRVVLCASHSLSPWQAWSPHAQTCQSPSGR